MFTNIWHRGEIGINDIISIPFAVTMGGDILVNATSISYAASIYTDISEVPLNNLITPEEFVSQVNAIAGSSIVGIEDGNVDRIDYLGCPFTPFRLDLGNDKFLLICNDGSVHYNIQ
jgi:hypothetical protein